MVKTAIFAPAADIPSRAGDRVPGLFRRASGALGRWRERVRQRRELAALSKRELADLGIPPGLAAYEAGRWPWQGVSAAWRELDRAHRAVSPTEPFPDRPLQPGRGRTARSALTRGRA
ncbi:MAG TPA: DUF1127 domain-containing protein [Stellaceae bacterium]|nr:DUF1127 domain-containing protein [Stellaceae bacterium]